MGNIASHAPFGPDASQWYPLKDGNYTVWQDAFHEKINKYCGNDLAFRIGRKVKGGGVSETAFKSMFGGTGAGNLRNAIAESSLGSYVGKKAGNIVLLVFGLLGLIVSIALAFALMRCCRGCMGKVVPNCREQRRCPPNKYEGFGFRVAGYKTTAAVSSGVLFALGICAFYFAARLNEGTKAITCDFWLTNYGHFYGTEMLGLPADAVKNWMGTAPLWEHMTQMAYMTNPRPDGEGGTEVCQLCKLIENAYSGPGGLVEKMTANRDTMAVVTNQGILVGEMAVQSVKAAPVDLGGGGDQFGPAAGQLVGAEEQQGVASAALLRSYATDLRNVTDTGIYLFRQAINGYLGRNSPVLQQGYSTATDSVHALDDVNYLMSKILVLWDKELYPLVRGLVTTLVVLTVLAGVWGICVGVFGFYLLWKFQADSRDNRVASETMTKLLGLSYASLVVFAGLSWLLFSVQMFAGSAGSDACRFVDHSLFEQGDWGAFPPRLLNETVTNQTSMEAVLDTCVKRSGDGDVAGSLGLRMLLASLRRNVELTAAELHHQVDGALMLNFREQKTEALVQIAKDVTKLVTLHRMPMVIQGLASPGADAELLARSARMFDLPQVVLHPRMNYTTTRLSLMNLVLGQIDVTNTAQLQNDLMLFGNLFQSMVPLRTRLAELETTLQNVAVPGLQKLCSAPLATQGICAMNGAFDVLDNTQGALVTNLFDEIYTRQGGAEGVEHMAQGLFELRQGSRFFSQNLTHSNPVFDIGNSLLSNFTADLPGNFSNILDANGVPQGLTFQRVLEDLVKPQIGNHCPGNILDCPLISVLSAVDDYFQGLAGALHLSSSQGAAEVNNFVDNTTLARFFGMLDSADADLANFNCQYLGTALETTVVTGLCGVAMPAVTSIGLVALLFTIFSSIGAWVLWMAYRYYRDIATVGVLDSSATALEIGVLPPFEPKQEKVASIVY